MAIEIKPFEANKRFLHDLFDHMKQVWEARGGELQEEFITTYESSVASGKADCRLFYQVDELIGFLIVERVTENYGTVICHDTRPGCREEIVNAICDSGLVDNMLFECFTLEKTDDYNHLLIERGAVKNHRKRTAYSFLENPVTMPAVPLGVYIEPYQVEHMETFTKLCADAHQRSKDYHGFFDLEDPVRRLRLETWARDNVYGEFLHDASFVMWKTGEPVGAISMIDTKSWGLDHVPWVFDVCIHNDYHGQGLGKLLMCYTMATLQEKGYSHMGLAVTLDNSARYLYEKLGFFDVEEIIELAYKIQ